MSIYRKICIGITALTIMVGMFNIVGFMIKHLPDNWFFNGLSWFLAVFIPVIVMCALGEFEEKR